MLVLLAGADAVWPCSCDVAKPACAYVGADAIFLGRVSFSNDDGSGTFAQATLVRFEVEEVFKGIPPGTKRVWVDPGSFTSCYEEYEVGKKYLIFARRLPKYPADSAAMTVSRNRGKAKPLPPDIDPAHPPVVYWAPECSGSRPAETFPNIQLDYTMLRAYRGGQSPARIFGRVFLAPYRGWPVLNGPQLSQARVTLTGNGRKLETTTRADGTFAFPEAPTGYYSMTAQLPPFVPAPSRGQLFVPEVGCGSEDFALQTTSTLQGLVLDNHGRPAAHFPVGVEVPGVSQRAPSASIDVETDTAGRFVIGGIPDVDFRLWYGSAHPSSSDHDLYSLHYYPNSTSQAQAEKLRLQVGEHRTGVVVLLPLPLRTGHFAVRVMGKDQQGVDKARVGAWIDGRITEFAETKSDGTARVECLEGLTYSVEAFTYAECSPHGPVDMIKSTRVSVRCGGAAGPFTLPLVRKGWN